MLAKASGMHWNARMGRTPKRTRTLANQAAATEITIRPITREKNGSVWVTHLVQGWKENGKWMRKQFADRSKAETFAALKRVEVENKGRAQRMVLSPLTDGQHEEALQCYDRLAGTYTLTDAITFFLKHHRPPEFTIRLQDALNLYLDTRERDGLRERTLRALKGSIGAFVKAQDNPWTHEVAPQAVESFLRAVPSRDGDGKASRKTWNNYRNDLHAFFGWCSTADKSTNRPFIFENPVAAVRVFSARQVREEQDDKPVTTSVADVQRIFTVLMRWKGGALLRYFALTYFAGIRPEELLRLAPREQQLVNLKTRTITIPANVSKTRHERKVAISDNLAAWLEYAPAEIIPTNFRKLHAQARKHFGLSHDEARHSFISYHVALHRSLGDAALQAGNSETIIRRHYLNLHPQEEGEQFFRTVPDTKRRRAVLRIAKKKGKAVPHLEAV
jgi:integrase